MPSLILALRFFRSFRKGPGANHSVKTHPRWRLG
jgi:hypothetical protein